MKKTLRKIVVVWSAILLSVPIASLACTDNAPYTCHTGGCGLPELGVVICTTDGTANQCVGGYGGAGATCVPLTQTCTWTITLNNPIFGVVSTSTGSASVSTTQTSGYCG